MDKAVRWAIVSADRATQPTLTAFVLPWWEDTAYFKWMQHPLVHKLARVPAKQFKFKRFDFWQSGQEFAGHPKWDVNIFVVANGAGLQSFVKYDKLQKEFAEASEAIGKHKRYIDPTFGHTRDYTLSAPEVYAPKAFTRMTEGGKATSACQWSTQPVHHLEAIIPSRASLASMWPAEKMWYTDGSAQDTDSGRSIGAGIHCQEQGVDLAVGCGVIKGPMNTITRAELCALFQSLESMTEQQHDNCHRQPSYHAIDKP